LGVDKQTKRVSFGRITGDHPLNHQNDDLSEAGDRKSDPLEESRGCVVALLIALLATGCLCFVLL
jgi:hypothetical protein